MFCTDAAPSHDEMYFCTSSRSISLTFAYHFHITFTSHVLNLIQQFAKTYLFFRIQDASRYLSDSSLNPERSEFRRKNKSFENDLYAICSEHPQNFNHTAKKHTKAMLKEQRKHTRRYRVDFQFPRMRAKVDDGWD